MGKPANPACPAQSAQRDARRPVLWKPRRARSDAPYLLPAFRRRLHFGMFASGWHDKAPTPACTNGGKAAGRQKSAGGNPGRNEQKTTHAMGEPSRSGSPTTSTRLRPKVPPTRDCPITRGYQGKRPTRNPDFEEVVAKLLLCLSGIILPPTHGPRATMTPAWIAARLEISVPTDVTHLLYRQDRKEPPSADTLFFFLASLLFGGRLAS
jgi:hypothetical protein